MSGATAETLAAALRRLDDGLLVVVTGAGISLASGIPTFRGDDPDAVWHRDIMELGTLSYFLEDPVGSWTWYTSRFDMVLDKQPNAAHHALVALESWQVDRGGRFLLVTQNVDTLHEQAGSGELVKVHGSADRVRCVRSDCSNGPIAGSLARRDVDMDAFLRNPCPETLPRCPRCGNLLRQHVLWFDEFYDGHQDYQWGRVLEAATTASLVLFVGTSFAVGVTDLFLRSALQRGTAMFSVDPAAGGAPVPDVIQLTARSEILLPAVCRELEITVPAADSAAPDPPS